MKFYKIWHRSCIDDAAENISDDIYDCDSNKQRRWLQASSLIESKLTVTIRQ